MIGYGVAEVVVEFESKSGKSIKVNKGNSDLVGFIPVYKTKELAEKNCPNRSYFKVDYGPAEDNK